MSEFALFLTGLLIGSLAYFLFIRLRVLYPLKTLNHAIKQFAEHPLSDIPSPANKSATWTNSKHFFEFMHQHFSSHHLHSEDFFQSLQTLHTNIKEGHYHSRIEGDYNKAHSAIQQEINAILATFDNMSEAITEGLKQLADGNFQHQIDQRIRGKMAKEFNRTNQTLLSSFHQINHLVDQLEEGNYSEHLNTQAQGCFKKLEGCMNQMIDSQSEMLIEAIEGLSALSSGQLTRRVNPEGYEGLDLAFIEALITPSPT